MAIRKSMQEEIVVQGDRKEWLSKCAAAARLAGFTKVSENATLNQVEGNYKKFMTWGTLVVTLLPAGNDTLVKVVSTANVDNIYALFKSPNKTIIEAFKKSLA